MAIELSGFEWLFLHARLLPDLQLSLMAQALAASPPGLLDDPAHAAAFADTQPSEDALRQAPGAQVDWFGVGDLGEAELAQLREAAERELAAFEASPPPALAPVGAGMADDAPIDLVRELANAYAQRDTVAPVAAAAFERIDRARLDRLLAAVATAGPALTAALSADGLRHWLQRMQEGDAALTALMDQVLDAGDWR